MLKIRLRRMGSRHRPFYRLVVSDSRRTPTGSAIEELGYYDPRNKPPVFKVNLERVDHWLSVGAQTSGTVTNLLRDARAGRGASAPVAEPEEKDKGKADKAEAKTESPKTESPKTDEAAAEGGSDDTPAGTPAAEASAEGDDAPAEADATEAEDAGGSEEEKA